MKVVFDVKPNIQDLNVLVRALCSLDVHWLKQNPNVPTLKQAKLRYISQDVGCERLLTIPQLYLQGGGDCDQLAPARAAELQVREGVMAWPEVIQITPKLYHVFVRYPNGRAEDISAHLGMEVPPKLVAAGRDILRTALVRKLAGVHGKARIRSGRVVSMRGLGARVPVGWPWW